MGNDREVIDDRYELATTLRKLIDGMAVVRLVDRDGRSPEQVDEARREGVRVLSRRNLECYLFDDEVLTALASARGLDERTDELLAKKQAILDATTDRAPDDLKPARGKIFEACKRILDLTQPGNTTPAFMRDTLAPLLKPGMTVYEELKHDIFGEATSLTTVPPPPGSLGLADPLLQDRARLTGRPGRLRPLRRRGGLRSWVRIPLGAALILGAHARCPCSAWPVYPAGAAACEAA